MASVTLDAVSKHFGGKRASCTAVDQLSLDIADRELLVLVGPSGCGKTTTLRLIAGLEAPTSGSISIGDREVNDVAPKDRDVAMVFQNYALYPHMNVFKNMAFGLRMRHTPRDETKRRVHDAASLLGIESLLERRPAELSGGEKQRVALGRAIVRRPAVFLFDEPLSNLDAKLRTDMRSEIKRLHRQLETTMIYVTHDQEEAMTLGDRVAVMREGALIQCAAPLDVYQHPQDRFVAAFIGSPTMNFLQGRIELDGENGMFIANAHRIMLSRNWMDLAKRHRSKELVLGVRPEHVDVVADSAAGDSPDGQNSLIDIGRMTIDFLEPLGDCTHVHLKDGNGTTMIANVRELVRFEINAPAWVQLRGASLHFFDATDGKRLQ